MDRRVERLLGSFGNSKLGLPAKLQDDRSVYLLITAGGAFVEALALARPAIPPRDLAAALVRSAGTEAGTTPVEWSAEEEYSAARLKVSTAGFGKTSGSSTAPVGRLTAGFRAAGFSPHVLFRTPKHTEAGALDFPSAETRSFRMYNASAARPDLQSSVHARMSGADVLSMLFFVGFVPVVGILGMATAILLARRASLPIETRRKLYPKLAAFPTFIAILLHAPLTFFYLQSSSPRVVVDLWFGTSGVVALAPFLMLPILPMALLLPVSNAVERKLFGPAEEVAAVEPTAVEKETARRLMVWSIVPSALGIALLLGRHLFLPRNSPLQTVCMVAAFAIIFLGPHVVRRLLRVENATVEEAEPELRERVERLAGEMGVRVRQVVVDVSTAGRTYVSALVMLNGRIVLSRKLVETLSESEQAFILAHEMAHLRRQHIPRRLALTLVSAAMFVLPISLGLIGRFPLPNGLILVSGLGGMLLYFVGTRWLSRRQELEADRLAVETTGDPVVAERALLLMMQHSPLPFVHEVEDLSTHPRLSRRLELLRAAGSAAPR
ncbi:MAG: M48 family metallopeptidase [Armatimonadota bacterium]